MEECGTKCQYLEHTAWSAEFLISFAEPLSAEVPEDRGESRAGSKQTARLDREQLPPVFCEKGVYTVPESRRILQQPANAIQTIFAGY